MSRLHSGWHNLAFPQSVLAISALEKYQVTSQFTDVYKVSK